MSSMTLYIKSSRRKESIGAKLFKVLEDNMRNVGIEKEVWYFKINELEKSLLYKNGYKH